MSPCVSVRQRRTHARLSGSRDIEFGRIVLGRASESTLRSRRVSDSHPILQAIPGRPWSCLPVPIGCVPVLRRVLSPATRSRRSQPCRRSRQRRAYASALPIHCTGATLQCHRRSTCDAPVPTAPRFGERSGPHKRVELAGARAPYAHTRGAQAALMPGARSHRTPHSGHLRRLGAGDETGHHCAMIGRRRSSRSVRT